jgi:protein-disulfide isomerase
MVNRRKLLKQKRLAQARRKRLWIIAGVVVIAVLSTMALILQGPRNQEVGEIVTVAPQSWPNAAGKNLGPAEASVVVVEYADFQCPFCRQYHDSVQPQLIDEFVKTGKVRYEYRHFIIIDRNVGGTESRRAAEASQCAVDQGKFWDYAEILFANQGQEGSGAFSDARLKAFAGAIGLDTDKFNTCLESDTYAAEVRADEAQAASLQLGGTPSVLVNGVKVANPLNYGQLQATIENSLAQAGQ